MLSTKQLLLFLALASGGMLGSALIGQYGFDLAPCDLCIYQRWPHGLVMALGLLGALAVKNETRQVYSIYACCVLLLIGAGIAIYHSGVEIGWFDGPDACSNDGGDDLSLEELRAQIASAALVSCNQAMAYIFGLSMAAWNALASSGLALLVLYLLRRKPHASTR